MMNRLVCSPADGEKQEELTGITIQMISSYKLIQDTKSIKGKI